MGYANADRKSSNKRYLNRGDELRHVFGADASKINELLAVNGVPKSDTIDTFNNIYRFGHIDRYGHMGNGREFVFFTKPDLHIVDFGQNYYELNPELHNIPFFVELLRNYPEVVGELQKSFHHNGNSSPLSNHLSNKLLSNVDIPSLSATTIETATNMFGTNYEYRGTSEASNDNYDFSLEFGDTRDLYTYMYFRAYDEYEMLKRQGRVSPEQKYIENKELHDEISIYKFITDETHERIIFYAEMMGVFWKNCPRDSFTDADFSNGLRYSIDCKAAFVDESEPLIIGDFNNLTRGYVNSGCVEVPIYNEDYNQVDFSPVSFPFIKIAKNKFTGKNEYLLKWYRK